MNFPAFKYPVYNPNFHTIDVATDWCRFPNTTMDPEVALAQPYKVATVCAMYNKPGMFCYDPAHPKVDLSRFDLVIVSDAEYSRQEEILNWIQEEGIKNYLLAIGGITGSETLAPDTIYRPYWLSYFLRYNTEFVDTYDTNKPYLFDTLLGARRPHRDYVMLAMTKNKLLDSSIVNYRNCFPGQIVNDLNTQVQQEFPDTTLNWPYVSPQLHPEWEVRSNIDNTVSFDTPWNIYRNTHYSIVCETIGTGDCFFFSEKIMKPMFAKRVFVLFGSQGYLRRLREFGFQTFEEFIDESYDDEPVDTIRYKKAMMQVMRLAWLETPERVKQHIDYVLKCNHTRLFTWQEQYQNQMSEMVSGKIPSRHFIWS